MLLAKFIPLYFLIWRISLFAVATFASLLIIEFGDKFPYYHEYLISTNLPNFIWGFGNFDGVHYIRIAIFGYEAQYSQVFFPLYPLLIHFLTIGQNYLIGGLLLSNLFFLLFLFVVYRLYRMDYEEKVSIKAIFLILAFPTAFYLGAVYSESLFLLLAASSIFLIRKHNFLLAGFLIALATGTRVFGVLLIPVMIIEIYFFLRSKEFSLKASQVFSILTGLIVAPVGLIAYMSYLYFFFGDPMYFLTAQPIFGAERSSLPIILLPQVFYRYLMILLTVNPYSLAFFNACLELTMTIMPLLLVFLAFKKVRFSYLIFTLSCLMIPTLTGTLSSMPRYALTSFLLFPFLVSLLTTKLKFAVVVMIIMQAILLMMFIRGYWVA